ncbi:MAG: penicillin-binding protein 2 [Endomicrobium sp.]|jgi:penicillin-binding protein 2|nr:penicillin-binding protein 2 [Endomicrobium sp.]
MTWYKNEKFSYEVFVKKYRLVFTLFILIFVCILIRLFYLQIVKGDEYKKISDKQSSFSIVDRAQRGNIYSENEIVLTKNITTFNVYFYQSIQNDIPSDKDVKELSKILGKDISHIINNSLKNKKTEKLADNLNLEKMFKVMEKKTDMNGIFISKKVHRFYCYPKVTSHMIGHVGEICMNELHELSKYGYKIGDYIGKNGIEGFYDKYLRGKNGRLQIETNAIGHQTGKFNYIKPEVGYNVHSTVNLELQKVAYNALKNSTSGKGAVVVLDVKTGAVKALVSCPGFDANKIHSNSFSKYLNDKKLPLFNRAIQAIYPPGSVFKIIPFVSALELDGVVDNEKMIKCNGSFTIGNKKYSCWNRHGHGKINLFSAIIHSCNVYFYKLGIEVGVKNLEKYARKFYFDQKTEIDLPNEKKGFVSNYNSRTRWFSGDIAIFSIGQSALWVTPIQVACMACAIANNGVYYNPYIVDKIINQNTGKVIYVHRLSVKKKIDLSYATWSILQEALLNVVENGTGTRCKISNIKIAGKTGTAQNASGYDHGWFASYAPANNPEIAMAVVVENGGSASSSAIPVSKKIYEAYFNKA